jgi:hypothetical protein
MPATAQCQLLLDARATARLSPRFAFRNSPSGGTGAGGGAAAAAEAVPGAAGAGGGAGELSLFMSASDPKSVFYQHRRMNNYILINTAVTQQGKKRYLCRVLSLRYGIQF